MGLQIPRFKKCCCCVPVRLGTLIIGYSSIVMSIITVTLLSFVIYMVSENVKNSTNVSTNVNVTTNVNVSTNVTNPAQPTDEENEAFGMYVTFGSYIVVFTIQLVISVILVYGAHTRQPKYMKIFCIGNLFLFVLGIVLVALTGVYLGILPMIGIAQFCVSLLMNVLIVRSAYLDIEEEDIKPIPQEMQPYALRHQEAPLMP